ncbi:MAG: 2-oxoacid:acceptor oxidoreductase subunit alpha [Thermoflavifilum sp.]|nr:2-oxoacid:acceptor oxidoreductase subunit alpha [Thermoflavifilum sp.]MCL6513498.1 2-oxoacid:acceptor oxidoreductase subunit alpha [Alicyclobacillus sp.]
MNDLVWRIGGKQGEGIETAGDLLSWWMHRHGFHVFAYRHFMSLVKGGHTTFTVRLADENVRSLGDGLNVVVALDQQTVDEAEGAMRRGSVLFYDTTVRPGDEGRDGVRHVALPISELAKAAGGPQSRNMVALGISTAALGMPLDALEPMIRERFVSKGEVVVRSNLEAVGLGFRHAAERVEPVRQWQPVRSQGDGALLITGNDAIALGALVGGCRFLAAYPITPATDIMYRMIELLPRVGGAVVQTEDEIAAVNMAIGANYAGVRGMTSTSGPGFSLMMEALGLAGMAEIPLVIVDVQRAGPSTGLPTKTEQSDVNEAVYGTHGDIPRIVLAPRTVEECFSYAAEAFNLSEYYQCPVILLSDMFLGTSAQTVPDLPVDHLELRRGKLYREDAWPNTPYRRYDPGAVDGISPRALPGQKGAAHVALGNEHDPQGLEIEDAIMRRAQVAKRSRKLATFALPNAVRVEGPPHAPFVIVGFGSSYGVLAEATRKLVDAGMQVKHVQLSVLEPFPVVPFLEAVHNAERILVVEQNAGAQLAGLIGRHTGLHERIFHHLHFDGTPMTPSEIVDAARYIFPLEVMS